MCTTHLSDSTQSLLLSSVLQTSKSFTLHQLLSYNLSMESDTASKVDSSSPASSKHPNIPPTDGFTITREDAKILSEYVEEFQDGDADMRTTIIANAMAELAVLREDGESFNKSVASKVRYAHIVLWTGRNNVRPQKIRKWFYNHYNRPERQYVKFIRRWSARNAFYHMCRDEVMMEAEEMSDAPPGSQAFLGSLQDATTKLWKNLPDEEQQLYVRLAKKWSEEPPPPHIQARYVVPNSLKLVQYYHSSRMASTVSAKIVRDFQKQLFKSCGVRCIVLTAHAHEDSQIITGL